MEKCFWYIILVVGCNSSPTNVNTPPKALSEPEQTVINFYSWYLEKADKEEIGLKLRFEPDSVIQIDPDTYFSMLLESGYIDDEYVGTWRDHLTACNEQLKADKQTDGIPDCIAADLITSQQEQPQGYVTTSAEISGDKATVRASGYDLRNETDTSYCCSSVISLVKKGSKWLITDID